MLRRKRLENTLQTVLENIKALKTVTHTGTRNVLEEQRFLK